MPAYFDTGALVPLYVREAFSPAAMSLVTVRGEPVPVHLLHRLEMENALCLKAFRGEMDGRRRDAVFEKVASGLREGRLVALPVDWIAALEEARHLGAQVTDRTGCRTLDLLHVAVAVLWGSEVFVTADDRQLKAARMSGLRTVDLRAFSRAADPGQPPAGAVREPRGRYATRRRPAASRRARP